MTILIALALCLVPVLFLILFFGVIALLLHKPKENSEPLPMEETKTLDERLEEIGVWRESKPVMTVTNIILDDDFIIEYYHPRGHAEFYRAMHNEFGDLGIESSTLVGIHNGIGVMKEEYHEEFEKLRKLKERRNKAAEITNVRFVSNK